MKHNSGLFTEQVMLNPFLNRGILTPRGELDDFVLLCSYQDKSDHVLHGIALRKSVSGMIGIDIVPGLSSFTENESLLTVSADVEEPRSIRVDPELHYIQVNPSGLRPFRDRDDVKDAIGFLLLTALGHTLREFHGTCRIPTVGVSQPHLCFVFISSTGKFTALSLTTKPLHIPAVVCVNHIQPGLKEPTFWRATCFRPIDVKPRLASWAKPMDVAALKAVIISAVLTFNALNCDSSADEVCDEDGVYHGVLNASPCPYDATCYT